MDKTSLGDRMKGYEKVPAIKLMTKTPVILRLDGKAFHTYTRGMDKPFDEDLSTVRAEVLKRLCENIQGAVFGYAQSDELSIVLKDWDTYQTDAWFGNKVQKLCSVSASMCTAYWVQETAFIDALRTTGRDKFSDKIALFDCRCFNVPMNEVINYLIWRQQDWERNSVQMIAQANYSHKELQGKSCKKLITLLEEEKGIVWGQLSTNQKRGEFWVRGEGLVDCPLFKEARGRLEENLFSNSQR